MKSLNRFCKIFIIYLRLKVIKILNTGLLEGSYPTFSQQLIGLALDYNLSLSALYPRNPLIRRNVSILHLHGQEQEFYDPVKLSFIKYQYL